MYNLRKEPIRGICMEMCPKSEIMLREKERLLHILEMVPGTQKCPVADKEKMVKSFSRSAAGKQILDPRDLRPPQVLLKTVNYLLDNILKNNNVPWHITYHFIMDRLRAIRQDLVIQSTSVTVTESICILQPIVRFYAYSAYRLCEEPISNFDPHINQTHLQECLKRLLCLYDEWDYLSEFKVKKQSCIPLRELERVRPTFEALYLILNLGNSTPLLRVLNFSKDKRRGIIELAILVSLNYSKNNYVKLGRLIDKLPVLLQAVAVIHLPEIRRRAFQTMSVAYNSKNSTFPLELLQNLLLYEDVECVNKDCIYYGVQCTERNAVFVKSDFNYSKTVVQPTHLRFIDDGFKKGDLSDLILNG
ncbi:SAC3 domain-containing protein 1 isoform X2 [Euwallacea fornicatus]|uniref:SAC3 domain-containing protein 1 isoform X2 n=1 Tax=Euwallacea fornicatus TaxID=995702 RepID=UPI00338EF7F1